MSLSVLIAAGGTGGHMIPADVLGRELLRRGHRVTLLTDARGLRFPGLFADVERHVVQSATASGYNPFAWARALMTLWSGRRDGRKIARAVGADIVVGFGGYPSLPGMLAGIALRLPVILHEQNAVMGRVNRRLAARVSAIALSYAETARLPDQLHRKVHVTGNPVRAEILATRDTPFQVPAPDAPFRLLVIGGSQGARILADRVPAAIGELSPVDRARLDLVQQCRAEDLSAVVTRYQALAVRHECLPYLADLPARLAAAHLVITRSGASTMAELMVAGRPAILIPFPSATDDHQAANANGFVEAGGGLMLREESASAQTLAGLISGFIGAPEALASAAAAARGLGRPDAAGQLADLVEREAHSLDRPDKAVAA